MAPPSATPAPTHWSVLVAMTPCSPVMAGQGTPRALLLDCLGTLVRLEPPGPRLQASLQARAGVRIGPGQAAAAVRAEIAYYRARLHQAVDRAALEDLRERCAVVVRDAVPALEALPLREVRDALLDALAFTPFDDVVPALKALRRAGLRLVVVSNWDV